MRPRPRAPRLEQSLTHPVEHRRDRLDRPAAEPRHVLDTAGHVEQVQVRELAVWVVGRVAGRLDAVSEPNHLGIVTEQVLDLRLAPDIERPFGLDRVASASLLGRHAVGILGREEPAVGMRQITTHIRQRVVGHRRERRVASCLRRLQTRQGQLRLVVEHLLEVRDPPGRVHRVAVEPATHVVAHPTRRHRPQGLEHHLPGLDVPGARMLAQQEQQLARSWKLGRVAKASGVPVEGPGILAHSGHQQVVVRNLTATAVPPARLRVA